MKRRSLWLGTRTTGDEDGQAVFEFLFVIPFVFILFYLMLEGVLILRTWSVLELASREGTRCAAIRAPQSDVTTRAVSSAGSLDSSGTQLPTGDISFPNGNPPLSPGDDVEVKISYPYPYTGSALASFLKSVTGGTPPALTLTAHTDMRTETDAVQPAGTCT